MFGSWTVLRYRFNIDVVWFLLLLLLLTSSVHDVLAGSAVVISEPANFFTNSTHPHLRTASGGLTIVPPDAVLSVTVALCWVGVRGADEMSVDLSDITFIGTNAALAVAFVDDGTCGSAEVTESMSVDVMIRNIDLTNDGMLVITGNMTHATKLSIVDTRVAATGATNKITTLQALVPNFSGYIEHNSFTDVAVALFIGGGGRGATGSAVRGTWLIGSCEFTAEESSTVSERLSFGVAIDDLREIAMRGGWSGFHVTRTKLTGFHGAIALSRVDDITFRDGSSLSFQFCEFSSERRPAFTIQWINSITFAHGASFTQSHCISSSIRSHGIAVGSIGSITFEHSSSLSFQHCTMTSVGNTIMFISVGRITFSNHSVFSQRHCTVTSTGDGNAFKIANVDSVTFEDHSTLSHTHCTMVSAGAHAFATYRVEQMIFTGGSTMAIADSTIESKSTRIHMPIRIDFPVATDAVPRNEFAFYNQSMFLLRNVLLKCDSCNNNAGASGYICMAHGGTFAVDTSSMLRADNVTGNRMPLFYFVNSGGFEIIIAATATTGAKATIAANFVITNSVSSTGFIAAFVPPISPGSQSPSALIYLSCLRRPPAPNGALVTAIAGIVPQSWIAITHLSSSCGVCEVNTTCFGPNTASVADSPTSASGCQCSCVVERPTSSDENAPLLPTIPPPVMLATVPCGPEPAVLSPSPPVLLEVAAGPGYYVVNSTHPHLRTASGGLTIVPPDAVLSVTVALCWVGVRGADEMSVDLSDITFTGTNAALAVAFVDDGTCGAAEVTESMSVDVMIRNIDLTNDGMLVITGNMTHATKLSIVDTRVVVTGATNKITTLEGLVPNFSGNAWSGLSTNFAVALLIGGGGRGPTGSLVRGTVLIHKSEFNTGQSSDADRICVGVAIDDLREIAMRGPGSGFLVTETKMIGHRGAFKVTRVDSISFRDGSEFRMDLCELMSQGSGFPAFGFNMINSIAFVNRSSFSVGNCNTTSLGSHAFYVDNVDNITFADHATFSQVNCTMTSGSSVAFLMRSVNIIVFANHSVFQQRLCMMESKGSFSLLISLVDSMLFQGSSRFTQEHCDMKSRANTFYIYEVDSITFANRSVFTQLHCKLTSAIGYAFVISRVNSLKFVDHSTFSLNHCTMTNVLTYTFTLNDVKWTVFTGGSSMAIVDSTIESKSPQGHASFLIAFPGVATVPRSEFAFYNASLFLLRNVLFTSSSGTNGGVVVISTGTFVVDTSSMVQAYNVTANRMPIFKFVNSGGLEITTAAAATKSAAAANFVIANSFAPSAFVLASAPPTMPASVSPLIFLSCLRRLPAPNGALVMALADAVPTDWRRTDLRPSCGVCDVSTACFGPNTASVTGSPTSGSGCQCTCVVERATSSDETAPLLPTIPPPVMLAAVPCGPEPAVLSPSPPILVELAAGPGYYVVNSTHPHLRTAKSLDIVPRDAVLSVTVALCWVGVRGADEMSVDLSDITFTGTNAALAVAFVDDGTCDAQPEGPVSETIAARVIVSNIDLTNDGMLVITGNMTHKTKLSIVDTRVVSTGATNKITTLQALVPNFSGNVEHTPYTDVAVALFIGGAGRGLTGSLVRGTVLIEGCEFTAEESSVNGRLSFGVAIDDLREIAMRGAGSGFVITGTKMIGHRGALKVTRANSMSFRDGSGFRMDLCELMSGNGGYPAFAFNTIDRIAFDNRSSFSVENCQMTSLDSHAFLIDNVDNITFADDATFSQVNCTMTGGVTTAVFFRNVKNIIFCNESVFSQHHCTITAPHCMAFVSVDSIVFQGNSRFMQEHCSMEGAGDAFLISGVDRIRFSNHSVFTQLHCTLTSRGSGSAFKIADVASVTFEDHSAMSHKHCTMVSVGSNAFHTYGVKHMIFTGGSTMAIADSTIESQLHMPIRIDFPVTVAVPRSEFAFYNASLFLLRNVLFTSSSGTSGGVVVSSTGTFVVDRSSMVQLHNVAANTMPIFQFANSGGLEITTAAPLATISSSAANFVIANSFAPSFFMTATVVPTTRQTVSGLIFLSCLRRPPAPNGALVMALGGAVPIEWEYFSDLSASCGVCEVNTACFAPNTVSVTDSTSGSGCQCTCDVEPSTSSDENAPLLPTIPPPVMVATVPCGPAPAVLSPSPPVLLELAAGPGYYVVNSTHPHLRTASGGLTIVPPDAVLSVTVALCWVGVRGADEMSVDLSDITFIGTNAALAVAFVDDGTCDAQPEGPVSESLSVVVMIRNIDLTKDGMLVITGNMTHNTKLSIVDTRVAATGATNKITTLEALVPNNFSGSIERTEVAVALFIGGGGRGPTGSIVRGTVLIDGCEFTADQTSVSERLSFGVVIDDLREISMRGAGSGFVMTGTKMIARQGAFKVARVDNISFRDGSEFRMDLCELMSQGSGFPAFGFNTIKSIAFENRSSFSVENCQMNSGGSHAFLIDNVDNITFTNHSTFSQHHCTITATQNKAFLVRLVDNIVFQGNSRFMQEHCSMEGAGDAFLISGVDCIRFSNHSVFTQLHCTLTSSGSGSAFKIRNVASVTFEDHSAMSHKHCTMVSVGSNAFHTYRVKHMIFTGGSTMSIADSTIESQLHVPIRIGFPVTVAVPRSEFAFYNASLFLLRNVLFTSSSGTNGGVVVASRGTFVVDTSSMVQAYNVVANAMPIFQFVNSGGLQITTAAPLATISSSAANFVIANSFAPSAFALASAPPTMPASVSPLIFLSCLRRPPAPNGALVMTLGDAVPIEWESVSHLSSSCGVCEVNTACFGPNTASVADSATSASGCQCTCIAKYGDENATALLPTIPPPVMLATVPCGPEPAVLSPSPPVMVDLAAGPGYYVVNSTHPHLRTASGGLTIVPPDAVLSVTVALCWVGVRGADEMSVDLSDISFTGTNAALVVAFVDDGTCDDQPEGPVSETMAAQVAVSNVDLTNDGLLGVTGNMTHRTRLSLLDARVVATGNKVTALQALVPNFGTGSVPKMNVALFIGGGGSLRGSALRGFVLIGRSEFIALSPADSEMPTSAGVLIVDLREVSMRGSGSGFVAKNTVMRGLKNGFFLSLVTDVTFADHSVFSQEDCIIDSRIGHAFRIRDVDRLSFSNHSIFSQYNNSMTSDSVGVFRLRDVKLVSFAHDSMFVQQYCTLETQGTAFSIFSVPKILFTDRSAFLQKHCTMWSTKNGHAFVIENVVEMAFVRMSGFIQQSCTVKATTANSFALMLISNLTVADQSVFTLLQCNVASGNARSGFVIQDIAGIFFINRSAFVIERCVITGSPRSGNAILLYNINGMSFAENSVMTIVDSTLESLAGGNTPLRLLFLSPGPSEVAFQSASMLQVRNVLLKCSQCAGGITLESTGKIVVDTSSVILADNVTATQMPIFYFANDGGLEITTGSIPMGSPSAAMFVVANSFAPDFFVSGKITTDLASPVFLSCLRRVGTDGALVTTLDESLATQSMIEVSRIDATCGACDANVACFGPNTASAEQDPTAPGACRCTCATPTPTATDNASLSPPLPTIPAAVTSATLPCGPDAAVLIPSPAIAVGVVDGPGYYVVNSTNPHLRTASGGLTILPRDAVLSVTVALCWVGVRGADEMSVDLSDITFTGTNAALAVAFVDDGTCDGQPEGPVSESLSVVVMIRNIDLTKDGMLVITGNMTHNTKLSIVDTRVAATGATNKITTLEALVPNNFSGSIERTEVAVALFIGGGGRGPTGSIVRGTVLIDSSVFNAESSLVSERICMGVAISDLREIAMRGAGSGFFMTRTKLTGHYHAIGIFNVATISFREHSSFLFERTTFTSNIRGAFAIADVGSIIFEDHSIFSQQDCVITSTQASVFGLISIGTIVFTRGSTMSVTDSTLESKSTAGNDPILINFPSLPSTPRNEFAFYDASLLLFRNVLLTCASCTNGGVFISQSGSFVVDTSSVVHADNVTADRMPIFRFANSGGFEITTATGVSSTPPVAANFVIANSFSPSLFIAATGAPKTPESSSSSPLIYLSCLRRLGVNGVLVISLGGAVPAQWESVSDLSSSCGVCEVNTACFGPNTQSVAVNVDPNGQHDSCQCQCAAISTPSSQVPSVSANGPSFEVEFSLPTVPCGPPGRDVQFCFYNCSRRNLPPNLATRSLSVGSSSATATPSGSLSFSEAPSKPPTFSVSSSASASTSKSKTDGSFLSSPTSSASASPTSQMKSRSIGSATPTASGTQSVTFSSTEDEGAAGDLRSDSNSRTLSVSSSLSETDSTSSGLISQSPSESSSLSNAVCFLHVRKLLLLERELDVARARNGLSVAVPPGHDAQPTPVPHGQITALKWTPSSAASTVALPPLYAQRQQQDFFGSTRLRATEEKLEDLRKKSATSGVDGSDSASAAGSTGANATSPLDGGPMLWSSLGWVMISHTEIRESQLHDAGGVWFLVEVNAPLASVTASAPAASSSPSSVDTTDGVSRGLADAEIAVQQISGKSVPLRWKSLTPFSIALHLGHASIAQDKPEYLQFRIPRRSFLCREHFPAGGGVSVEITVTPRPTLVDRNVMNGVATTGTIASSVTVSPTVAITQARLGSVQAMMDCRFDHSEPLPAGVSPTGYKFGSLHGQYYRGTVIGNFALFLGFVLLTLVVGSLIFLNRKPRDGQTAVDRFVASFGIFHAPSILIVALCIGLQGTVSTSMSIYLHAHDPNDAAIGTFGGVSCLIVVVWITRLLLQSFPLVLQTPEDECVGANGVLLHGQLQVVGHATTTTVENNTTAGSTAGDGKKVTIVQRVGAFFKWQFTPKGKWVAKQHAELEEKTGDAGELLRIAAGDGDDDGPSNNNSTSLLLSFSTANSDTDAPQQQQPPRGGQGGDSRVEELRVLVARGRSWKHRHYFFFADYRLNWYLVLELWVSFALGVIDGIRISEENACTGQAAAVVFGFFALTALCGWLRPGITPFMTLFIFATNACGFVSAMLLTVGQRNESDKLLGASELVSLVAMLMSVLKFISDIVLALIWFKHRGKKLMSKLLLSRHGWSDRELSFNSDDDDDSNSYDDNDADGEEEMRLTHEQGLGVPLLVTPATRRDVTTTNSSSTSVDLADIISTSSSSDGLELPPTPPTEEHQQPPAAAPAAAVRDEPEPLPQEEIDAFFRAMDEGDATIDGSTGARAPSAATASEAVPNFLLEFNTNGDDSDGSAGVDVLRHLNVPSLSNTMSNNFATPTPASPRAAAAVASSVLPDERKRKKKKKQKTQEKAKKSASTEEREAPPRRTRKERAEVAAEPDGSSADERLLGMI